MRISALDRRTRLRHRAALGVLACGSCAATWGQEASGTPPTALTPSFSAGGSYLETRSRSDGANGREFVGTVTPGLLYVSRSGRLQGTLDLRSTLIVRRGLTETAGSEVQNTLSAGFVAEAVPNRVFVDARAGISQQAISPYGEQSVEGSARGDSNRTEVRTFALSPYVRSPLGAWATFELRLNGTATRSRDAEGVDSNTSGGSLALRSAPSNALLGWFVQASSERIDYEEQQPVENRRASVGLSFAPYSDLRLNLRGGRESIEEGTVGSRAENDTVGVGLQWLPTPRTNVSFDIEDRYFGRAARVALLHRMPRSIWTYSFSRDATDGADARGAAAPVTLYDLLFAQAASAYPDPAVRETVVRDFISASGQDPNQIVSTGFQSAAVSLQRRQDLSIVWLGRRTTVSVQGYTSSLSQIVLTSATDPVIGEAVRQHGYLGSLSYQLTPQASVVFAGSRQMTYATRSETGNDLKSASVALTNTLGRRTSTSLAARYTVFNSPTDPYRETSVTASLNLRF
jgi:uncharacterized protein (PEP-CTERM system associated)